MFHCSQSDTTNNTQTHNKHFPPSEAVQSCSLEASGEEAELHWATDLAVLTKEKRARGQEAGGSGSNSDWLRGKQAARLLSVIVVP